MNQQRLKPKLSVPAIVVIVLGGFIAATLALVAAPATAATVSDVCALLTPAEAKQVLLAPVKIENRGKRGLMVTGYVCKYEVPATHPPLGGSIELTVYDDASVAGPDSMFKSAADYFQRNTHALRSSGSKLVAVPGLGDSAWWDSGADLLHVLDRGIYIRLSVDPHLRMLKVTGLPGKQYDKKIAAIKRTSAIQLARDILPRLQHTPIPASHRPPAGSHGGHSS